MGEKLSTLTASPLFREHWGGTLLPPVEVQAFKVLHGLQQAVLQAAVPQQQQGQICAIHLPVQPQTATQASEGPPGRAAGIRGADRKKRRRLGVWNPVMPQRGGGTAGESKVLKAPTNF